MGQFSDSLKRYFEETPQDILDRDWEDMKLLNEIGPDVFDYVNRVRMCYDATVKEPQNVLASYFSQESFTAADEFYLAA